METKMYTFKEICNKTEYKSSVIRYYEKEFKLDIPRDKNGRRIFTEKELKIFMVIKGLKKEGKTNKEIKDIISKNNDICLNEVAITTENEICLCVDDSVKMYNTDSKDRVFEKFIYNIDDRLNKINVNINELNRYVNSKERDVLISENMKLKLELKEKSYELLDVKNRLKSQTQKRKSFLSKLFKKQH